MKFNGILRKGINFKLINIEEFDITSEIPSDLKSWECEGIGSKNIFKLLGRVAKLYYLIDDVFYRGECILDEVNANNSCHIVGSGKLSRKQFYLLRRIKQLLQ